jgi:hypothetical protein
VESWNLGTHSTGEEKEEREKMNKKQKLNTPEKRTG